MFYGLPMMTSSCNAVAGIAGAHNSGGSGWGHKMDRSVQPAYPMGETPFRHVVPGLAPWLGSLAWLLCWPSPNLPQARHAGLREVLSIILRASLAFVRHLSILKDLHARLIVVMALIPMAGLQAHS